MPYSKIKELLEQDMEDVGLNQRQLGERLNRSQQAISAWFARDKVPASQINNLRKVLGPESKLVRYLAENQGFVTIHSIQRGQQSHTLRPPETQETQDNDLPFKQIIAEELGSQGLEGSIEIEGHRFRLDYVSTTLACEIMNLNSVSATIPIGIQIWHRGSRRVLDLAVIKKARPKMRCVIALVAEEIVMNGPTNRLTMYCNTLGIDVWICGHIEEVADLIVKHETELVKEIPFLDIND